MKRFPAGRASAVRGGRLFAVLLVAVVVPSACVLWFMNEAVTSQADAARRAVADAYRGQLRLVRGRVSASWQARAAQLESGMTGTAAEQFKRLVLEGNADSVVILGGDGVPLYPSLAPSPAAAHERAASMTARSAQALVRNMLRTHDTQSAIETITSYFVSGAAVRGRDADGRLIAADEQLLLINLLKPADTHRSAAIARLGTLLNDYSTTKLPAAQRLFLMDQLVSAPGQAAAVAFPTMAAERLAIAFLETERPARGEVALRATGARDVWQLSSPASRVVALYRTGTVKRQTRAALDEYASSAAVFDVTEPGAAATDEAVAIGRALPGWELSFVLREPSGQADAIRARRSSYLALALLAIGVIAIAVATLGGSARRQARLASLKTDLVSAVSHELKTPLASMRLLVDALLEDEHLDPAKTRDYLQLVAAENARLSRLIENFLTFSRLERNRHQFTFTTVQPADVIRDVMAAVPERIGAGRLPTIDVAPDLPTITADKDALVTAILNLLDNAYKYTPANQQVSVRAFRDGAHVAFAVDDNGIGIPPREQKRIFRRFYRVDQRLARETAGTGLGLSIVDAIVRAHGGSVQVVSRPERGSTFAVRVPCAVGEALS